MASTITAKIAPLPRGDYSSSATYDKLDIVSYNGSSYMAIKAVPTGTVPTNTTYWQLLAEKPTIGAGSIATNMLADGAITTAKLANGSVTDAKLVQTGGVLSRVGVLENALIDSNEVTLTQYASDIGTSAMPKTRRWFLPDVVPADSFIGTIKYHTASATSGKVVFEIWEKNGNVLTRVKDVESTPIASSINEVTMNYRTETETMIGWKLVDGTSLRSTNNTYDFVMYASTDLDSTTINMTDSSFKKNDFPKTRPCTDISYIHYSKKIFDLPSNVVLIGEGMDFEEIQDALIAIDDDSINNPYTLLVMPKGTPYEPFSMLRNSFSDTYPWHSVSPRYISIIGLDKVHCVIQSDSGDYKLPCGEPMINGIIKNLTFIMTNDEQDLNATQGGYCLHIDCRTLNDVGYNMVIEDCDFEDSSGPCLGIGMHKNCTLTLRRCNFKTTLLASYMPFEGYRNLVNFGVIFCHSSSLADSTNQRINVEDCFGTCKEGTKSLWITSTGDYDPTTASFYYRLLRNVFWNEQSNAAAYSLGSDLTADPMNFGNNNA